MKKLSLVIVVTLLFTGFAFSQKIEMKVGEKIEVNELVNKKEKKTGAVLFKQNGQKLKYVKMFKTLEGIDACTENMKLAKKHRTGALVMTTIGVLTIPLGYLILVGPIMSKKKKEVKYVILAIEDYNKSLEQIFFDLLKSRNDEKNTKRKFHTEIIHGLYMIFQTELGMFILNIIKTVITEMNEKKCILKETVQETDGQQFAQLTIIFIGFGQNKEAEI